MEFEVGSVLEGKVTGITSFGAFVALPGGKSGLVHISEIAHSYVSDVREFLTEGQDVKVKVINIDDNNRINLSIKKAVPPPPRDNNGRGRFGGDRRDGGRPPRDGGDRRPNFGGRDGGDRRPPMGGGDRRPPMGGRDGRRSDRPRSGAPMPPPPQPKGPASFEDQLKKFMQDSDSRQSDLNRFSEKRSSRRGNGRGRNNF